jgi:hypothetical protein
MDWGILSGLFESFVFMRFSAYKPNFVLFN